MSESTKKNAPSDADMLAALVKRELISQAQADLVKSDSDAMGMSMLELLIARHWVKEDSLAEVLAQEASSSGSDTLHTSTSASSTSATASTSPSSTSTKSAGSKSAQTGASPLSHPLTDDYNENLARYKKLIAKILRNEGA